MKDFTMILVGLFFGFLFGYIGGLATSYGYIEELANRKFQIVGNVTVENSEGKPIEFGGVEVNSNDGIAISINGPVQIEGE